MPTNTHGEDPGSYAPPKGDIVSYPKPGGEGEKLGYETTDVNVKNVIVFIGGLFGFVLIFFVFCFGMGKVINTALEKQDGPLDQWHKPSVFVGAPSGKREDLASTTEMEQKELASVTQQFPNPRLDTDDGNQATADLHAKEDLLLENYSTIPGEQGIRIPIDRAMELIAQRGLPVEAGSTPNEKLAGDEKPVVLVPLTSGFARTGYELDTIEAREQKINYGKAQAAAGEPK